jgi:parallel beta-helix repeat protein
MADVIKLDGPNPDNLFKGAQNVNAKFEEVTAQLAQTVKKIDTVKSVLEYEHLKVSIANGYDWQPAIQKAIDDVFLLGGGEVIFPYRIDYRINNRIIGKSGVVIKGLGFRPKIINDTSSVDYMLYIDSQQKINVENIDFDVNKATNKMGTTMCIFVRNSNDITIKENTLQKAQGDGVYVDSCTNVVIERNFIDDIDRNGITFTGDIKDCIAKDNLLKNQRFCGINAEDDDDFQFVHNLQYINNQVYGVGFGNGINFTTGITSITVKKYQNCKMKDNYIEGFTSGITVRLCLNVEIVSNTLKNVKRAIQTNPNASSQSVGLTIKNNKIDIVSPETNIAITLYNIVDSIVSENTINNAGSNAIYAHKGKNVEISRNRINVTAGKAIEIRGGFYDGKVDGNIVVDPYLTGIKLQSETVGEALNTKITGNTVYRTGTGVDTRYGIEFTNSPTKCIVKDNDIARVSNTSLYNVDITNNIVVDNFVK